MVARSRLGERLRNETRAGHLAAERAFELPRRLRDVGAYADGLTALAAVHEELAPRLQALAPALPVALRDGPSRRRAALRADLAALGRPIPLAGDPAPAPAAAPAELDGALGAWYVQEGAALGGLVIAEAVRRRLPAAAPATRFFSGEGAATAERWRLVQATLGDWEWRGELAVARVLAGADDAFARLLDRFAAVAA